MRPGAQFSFTLHNEDGRRMRGTESVTLAFDSQAEAERWAAALQEALHALRARVRPLSHCGILHCVRTGCHAGCM